MASGVDPLAELRDIRVPAPTVETLLADILIAIAAGILLGLFLALLARLILRRRRSRRETLIGALEATRHLPLKDRLFAQAAVLKRAASDIPPLEDSGRSPFAAQSWTARLDRWLGGDFFSKGTGAKLREVLYHREPDIDPDTVDRELVRLIRRARD